MMLRESCDAIKIISCDGIMRCRGSTTTRLRRLGTHRGKEYGVCNEKKRARITTKKIRLRDRLMCVSESRMYRESD